MNIVRVACFAYWSMLAAGLVVPGGDRIAGRCIGLGDHPDILHFLAFAALATLVYWARLPWSPNYMAGALVAYAIAAEAAQCVIPGRTANLMDCAANVAGIAAGLAVSYGMRRIAARCIMRR